MLRQDRPGDTVLVKSSEVIGVGPKQCRDGRGEEGKYDRKQNILRTQLGGVPRIFDKCRGAVRSR
jgi:hypothetical protein